VATDGGRNGICGYVYQAILLLNMIVRTNDLSGDGDNDDELDALLTLARPASASMEAFDEDIALYRDLGIGHEATALVQVKYSRQDPPESISGSDMQGIIKSLDRSSLSARRQGTFPEAFVLVTNRPVSADARALSRVIQIDEQTSWPINAPPTEGLLPVRVVTSSSLDRSIDKLYAYGKCLGATRQETSDGIDRLVSQTMRAAAAGMERKLDKSAIARAIAGSSDARPLTPQAIASATQHRLSTSFARPLSNQLPIMRESVIAQLNDAVMSHALVVLTGQGGCGKTASLWHWAYDKVMHTPPDAGAFTEMRSARIIPHSWVAQTICDWALIHDPDDYHRRDESHARAVSRLSNANEDDYGTILYLGVDGLDEQAAFPERITELLTWAWGEEQRERKKGSPRFVIVVTSRGRDDILQAPKGLQLSASGFHPPNTVVTISVSDFDDFELYQAIRAYVPDAAGSASRVLDIPVAAQTLPLAAETGPSITIDDFVLDALHHPAMWGALLALADDVRLHALQGHAAAVDALCNKFVGRVYTKAHERNQDADLMEESFFDLCSGIATTTAGDKLNPDTAWYSVAQQEWELSKDTARRLLNEAASAGLVTRSGRLWRWRHPIVWSYLQRRAVAEAVV